MTALGDFFRAHPVDDVLRLVDIDPLLIAPSDTADATVWISNTLEVIAGARTPSAAIRELLREGRSADALRLTASSRRRGVILDDDVVAQAEEGWQRILTELESTTAITCKTLERVDQGELDSDGRALAQMIADDLRAGAVASTLRSPDDVDAALRRLKDVRGLASEAEGLLAEAESAAVRNREAVAEVARNAFETLLGNLLGRDHSLAAGAAVAIAALPQLVRERAISILEEVAAGRMDHPVFQALAAAPRPATNRPPRARRLAGSTTVPVMKRDLSGPSRVLLESATLQVAPLETQFDVQRASEAAGQLRGRRRAALWLSYAKATPDPALGALAMGRGLLAGGWHYLSELDQPRMAGMCLVDAVSALSDASEHRGDQDVERAVVALIAAQGGASTFGAASAGSASIGGWLDEPGLLFDWMRRERLLGLLGNVWARAPEGTDRAIYDVALAHLGDERQLASVCACAVLNVERLTYDPERVLRRLQGLLAPAHPSEAQLDALGKLSNELAAQGRGRVPPDAAFRIIRSLQALESALSALPRDTAAPVEEVLERLPGIVRERVDVKEGPVRSRLTVGMLAQVLYPDERASELRLPLVVRNAEDGGLASDIHIHFSIDAADASRATTVGAQEKPVPTLEPGAAEEVSFYLDVDKQVLQTAVSLRFRVQLKRGIEVLADTALAVAVRPSPRRDRSSPYSPGVAVEGDAFVGREKQVKQLTDALLNDDAVRVPVVTGIRRIGKTSILFHVRDHHDIARRYVVEYLSLDSRPDSDTSEHFLIYLAERIRGALGPHLSQGAHLPFSRAEFREDPYAAFDHFCAEIDRLRPAKRLLLVMDEFDKIVSVARASEERQRTANRPLRPNETLQPEIFGSLRKLILTSRSVRVMIAGLPALLRLGHENRLFGLLTPVPTRSFSREEADRIIDVSKDCFSIQPSARESILRLTGMQPYLLQVLCHELFVYMLDSGRDSVTERDVHHVVEETILPHQTYFADYEKLIGPEQVPLLRAIARVHRDAPRSRLFASIGEIVRELRRSGENFTEDEVSAQLAELEAEDRPLVVRPDNSRTRFRLAIGLLGEFLLKMEHVEG